MFNSCLYRRMPILLSPLFLAFALPALGDCSDPSYHWAGPSDDVNVRHVFCGEIGDNGKVKGFHSIQLKASSTVVRNVTHVPTHTPAAIYDAQVDFNNGRHKLSTFFPDQCTESQIIMSIDHAFKNQTGPHPQWGVLGNSAPSDNAEGYCLTTDGKPFQIRMGLIDGDSKVNTAFPSK